MRASSRCTSPACSACHAACTRIRRVWAGLGWAPVNLVITLGSYRFAIGVLMFLFNVWRSQRREAQSVERGIA
jgi:heme/copper-type cytochrome/quinol oxidase subunit 1